MPQGLSISPILCTTILSYLGPPRKLKMFADDGLYLGLCEDREFKDWRDRVEAIGIPFVPEKSRQVLDGKFTFVGVIWDLEACTLTSKKSGAIFS